MNCDQSFIGAVLTEVNQPLQLMPLTHSALSIGQVLVKIKYAAVCHSQLMEARGKRGEDKYIPHLMGHEGVGEVIKTHESVSKVSKGDKVVLGWIKGKGLDSGGTQYHSAQGLVNGGPVTTFSTYSVVSENRLVPVPQNFDEKLAVLLGCALPTGAGIVLNQVQPEKQSTVLVYGLGGIGLSALLALKHFDVKNIVAVDIENHKLELAKELGATHCFSASKQGLAEIQECFPGGVDYAIESAGRTDTIETAFSLVKNAGGKCYFASHPEHGKKIQLDPFDFICGKQLIGSWGGASNPDQDLPIIADIINKYQLPVRKLLSKEYNLPQINEALDDLEKRKIVRALIRVEQ